jgi:formylglycine-generating enzyme required for sulfatase activity
VKPEGRRESFTMGNNRNLQSPVRNPNPLSFIVALGLICSTRATEVPQAKELANYTETIPGSTITFEMVAIAGGSFMMGSPDSEGGRKEDE